MRYISAFLLVTSSLVVADYHTASSEDSFEKLINKYPYTLVCFVPSRSEDKESSRDEKREVRDDYKDFKKRMRAASKSGKYDEYLEDDVGFLLVDIASRRAQEVDDQYKLDQIPVCLLFKHGQPVMDGGRYAQINSTFSKYSMLSILDQYFKNEFEEIIDNKKEEEKLKRQENIARYHAYANSPHWYGGYWGWGHRPYWGWRSPHWGYGYRSWC